MAESLHQEYTAYPCNPIEQLAKQGRELKVLSIPKRTIRSLLAIRVRKIRKEAGLIPTFNSALVF